MTEQRRLNLTDEKLLEIVDVGRIALRELADLRAENERLRARIGDEGAWPRSVSASSYMAYLTEEHNDESRAHATLREDTDKREAAVRELVRAAGAAVNLHPVTLGSLESAIAAACSAWPGIGE